MPTLPQTCVDVESERCDARRIEACFRAYPDLFATALTIRTIEERVLQLFRKGLLNGTVHTCIGQELVSPAVCRALNGKDWVLSTHRGHGHFYACTGDLTGLLGELMGKTCGASGGVGGSQHLAHRNYLSNGIQGGMAPVAAGLAFAARRRRDGSIAVAFIGDGTLGEGSLYEAFNVVGALQLPILFVLEHNQYAQSTNTRETVAGDLQARIEGFGLGFARAGIWDPATLLEAAETSISSARSGHPEVLVVDCYRLSAHSTGDDNRAAAEIDRYRAVDPLNVLAGLRLPEIDELKVATARRVDVAVEELRSAPTLVSYPNLLPTTTAVRFARAGGVEPLRFNEQVNQVLRDRLAACPEAIVVGEDICDRSLGTDSDYGGAFKVTRGLSTAYPDRVLNFPISEAALVGFGTGLALAGLRPIVEIMFGDFMTLAFDQIYQHAAKFRSMFNGRVRVPLVIRTPMGGKRGYGPTHSQSIEKFFLGMPDLTVVALNAAVPAARVYDAVFELPDPVLVIENKVLYTLSAEAHTRCSFRVDYSDESLPTVRLAMGNLVPDVTIVCYGEMLGDVERAARQAFVDDEIVSEILCPTCVHPLNAAPIAESVRRSRRLLVVEEGPNVAAFGTEVLARVAEEGVRVDVFRRLGNNNIVPSSLSAELNLIPNPNSIGAAIRQCARAK